MDDVAMILSVVLAFLCLRLISARKRLIARSRKLQDELRSVRELIDQSHMKIRILLDRHGDSRK